MRAVRGAATRPDAARADAARLIACTFVAACASCRARCCRRSSSARCRSNCISTLSPRPDAASSAFSRARSLANSPSLSDDGASHVADALMKNRSLRRVSLLGNAALGLVRLFAGDLRDAISRTRKMSLPL